MMNIHYFCSLSKANRCSNCLNAPSCQGELMVVKFLPRLFVNPPVNLSRVIQEPHPSEKDSKKPVQYTLCEFDRVQTALCRFNVVKQTLFFDPKSHHDSHTLSWSHLLYLKIAKCTTFQPFVAHSPKMFLNLLYFTRQLHTMLTQCSACSTPEMFSIILQQCES